MPPPLVSRPGFRDLARLPLVGRPGGEDQDFEDSEIGDQGGMYTRFKGFLRSPLQNTWRVERDLDISSDVPL